MNIITKLAALFFLGFLFTGCQKDKMEDVICDNAQINLCNNTPDQILVYGFNSNRVSDTLFPGECELRDYGQLTIKYHKDGSLKESNSGSTLFTTLDGSAYLGITTCYWEYSPDFGYQNISFCYNGVFDPKEREYDTDCGGKCLPCGNISLPCSLEVDKFRLNNQSSSYGFPSTYAYNEINNKRIIEFTFSNGEILHISIPFDDVPLADKRFLVGSEYWESDVWFTDRFGFNRYDGVDGSSVYFMVDSDGNQSVQFCDLDLTRNNGQTIVQGTGYLKIDQKITN